MSRWRFRPDPGLLLAAVAGLLLLFVLFLPWFCLPGGSLEAEGAVVVAAGRCWNAWVAFSWLDLVLLLTALAAVAPILLAGFRIGLPVRPGRTLAGIGAGVFLAVLYRLASPPWAGAGRAAGPFLALLCLAGVAAGGLLSERLGRLRNTGPRRVTGSPERPGQGRSRGRGPAPDPGVTGFRDFNREGEIG